MVVAKKVLKKAIISQNFIPILILALSLILYNYFWDLIVSARIWSISAPNGATVWDLGASYYSLWGSLHISTMVRFEYYLAIKPIVFILSPLFFLKSAFDLVYFQTLWISLTAIPLYFIAIKKIKSRFLSLLLAVSYLLFFGIAGLNWFDFHFQSIFPILFISGYSLYLYDKKILSIIFFVLSGLVHFPYTFLPLIISFAYLLENLRYGKRTYAENFNWIWVFLLSFFIVIMAYVLIAIGSSTLPVGATAGLVTKPVSPYINLDNRIFTIFLFFGPFLMLPLLSKKWLFLALPYFYLLFYIGNYTYYFPAIISLQYTPLLIPTIFLGTIDVLSEMDIKIPNFKANNENNTKTKAMIHSYKFKKVLTIFIIIILLGTVYEPYGIFNEHSEADFGLNKIMDYNSSIYDHYIEMVDLLPTNSEYILYQNDMPQVIFRDPAALTTHLFGYSNNFSYFIPNQNSFIPLSSGNWTSDIQYILTDPYSYYFLATGSGNYSKNMYDTLNHFLSEGDYGILGEYDGLLLVKKGYSGAPVIYGPENKLFSSSDLFFQNNGFRYNNTITGVNLENNNLLFWGPYTTLQPGTYEIKMEVSASNISSNNRFDLLFSYYSNISKGIQSTVKVIPVNGTLFSQPDKFVNISFVVNTSLFLEDVQFTGMNFHWAGKFSIKSISVDQIAPG